MTARQVIEKVTIEATLDCSEGSPIREAILGDNGCGYWAIELDVTDFGLRMRHDDPDGTGQKVSTAPWSKVAEAVGLLATARYWDPFGELRSVENPYMVRAAIDFLFNPDDVDYDTDVMDHIIQQAILGKQVFG